MAQKKIGAKIVIDGEQEFRSALQQSKNALKEFDSELKLVTAQFKNNERSMDALKAKQAVYQKQQQELTKTSQILVDQIQKANTAYKSAEAAQAQQAEKIKKLEKALEEARKEYGDSAEEVERLERELSDANTEYEQQGRQLTSLSNKITKWNTELNKTQTELVQTDQALDDTNAAIEHFDEGMEDAEEETRKFGLTMSGASEGTDKLKVSLGSLVSAQIVVDVLRNCARAIKEVAEAAIDVGTKFEASMSKVEALSGASGDQLERLSAKAKEMGASTIYSASESADAFSYMALAGWEVEEMLEGIGPVLNLAASANMDLAEASDIVTDYLTAFGLKAEDAGHFADAMATAMATSNTTVEMLGESYKNCAATCASMGIEMEDATAVLATMANAGVKGAEAGTALNTILTRLATNTKGAADKLEDYGVAVYDVQGNMNSISSILNGLGEIWGDLSDKEQAALAKTVAGTAQYSKLQTIMLGVSDAAKEGGQSFSDYAEALRDCDGAAEDMAKTMQYNLTGDVTILKSALEGLGIATEGAFDDAFREAVQGATEAVSTLERAITDGDLGVSLANLGDQLSYLTQELIDAAVEALPGFIDGLSWLIDHLEYIGAGIKTVIAGFAAYKIATVAATVATEGFTVALNLNPIGLLATALTTVVVSLYEYSDAMYESARSENEVRRRTEELINESERLNEALDNSINSRKKEITSLDSQAEASKKLIAQLYDEKTAQNDRLRIVDELKSMYPELNLEIDEQGRLIGQTRAELEKYIDASLQLAKVEAAKEHLTEIAKEQFEAEQKLVELKKQQTAAQEEYNKAEAAYRESQMNAGGKGGNPLGDYENYKAASDQLNELNNQIKETETNVNELGEEYQQTLDYINDNGPIEEATESTEELAEAEEAARQASEELAKEFEELEKSIAQSISSSLDLTNKWSQEWKTSTEQMTANIDSQIEGIENWSKNFQLLADNAQVQIDSRVMKYLADMGVEGAGLVQELVDTLEKSPEELANWSESMSKYLSLEDTVAAEITESYATSVEEGINGAKEAIESADLAGTTQKTADEIAASMTNIGHDAVSSVTDALEEGADDVKSAAETSGDSVVDGFKAEIGENGEKVGEIGEKADEALADAFLKGKAKDAALTVAQDMVEDMKTTLSEDEGYSIGETFMNGMKNAIELVGEQVIAAAQVAADEAKRILENAGNSNNMFGTSTTVPGHANGLDYVPYDNYLARLHEGERVLTKEENAQYMALLGSAKAPSFDTVQSRAGDLNDSRAVVINNDITVDGAQDPEAWTQTFIRTLKREARMA